MQLPTILLASLLAASASAFPAASSGEGNVRRALCTPQDNTGFTVRINSTDDLNGKILSIQDGVVGVDLPHPESVIWPYTDGQQLAMPGPGYKYILQGYLYSTDDLADGQQLRFSREVPPKTDVTANGVSVAQTDVFSTSCDIRGTFYLSALEGNWNWQACRETAGTGPWTIKKQAGKGECRDVRLRMNYGPPY
ncbi:hypothetical protein TWF696_000998 [Orbilia brochopaga]|uniref:Uncharacterized protein n=1 Tax=Orbilia brochopaga TaxID=3140254 RepID=A0AAV9VFC0_9PEZI